MIEEEEVVIETLPVVGKVSKVLKLNWKSRKLNPYPYLSCGDSGFITPRLVIQ